MVIQCNKVMLSKPVAKCHNKDCHAWKADTGKTTIHPVDSNCGGYQDATKCGGYQDVTKCDKYMTSWIEPVQSWAEEHAIKLMTVAEANTAGLLKNGVRIRTNANLDRIQDEYLTGTISHIDWPDLALKRDDRGDTAPLWCINIRNTVATIEILEDVDKKRIRR